MGDKSKLIRAFTGSALTVNLLKDELQKQGISSFIQDDFSSGIAAGFSGGTPSSVDLFVKEIDAMRTQIIINEFRQNNEG